LTNAFPLTIIEAAWELLNSDLAASMQIENWLVLRALVVMYRCLAIVRKTEK
jgi:hypothetical protein